MTQNALSTVNNRRIALAIRRRAKLSYDTNGPDVVKIAEDLTTFLESLVALDVIGDYVVTPMNAKFVIDVAFSPQPYLHFVYVPIVISDHSDKYDDMPEDLANSLGY